MSPKPVFPGGSVSEVYSVLSAGGFPALLILVIIAGARGDWVSRREMADLRQERDEWKALANTATQTVAAQGLQISKLTEVVETLTDAIGKRLRR